MGNSKYVLSRLLERKGKDNKVYHYAHLLFFMPTDTELIKVYISSEQFNALKSAPKDIDINDYVSVEYNTFKKAYEPKISYGL